MNDLAEKLAAFREALPHLDAKNLGLAGDMLLSELEAMPPAMRDPYRGEIVSLISALETRILSLEQEAKQADTF